MALARIDILEGRTREERRAIVAKRRLYRAIVSRLGAVGIPSSVVLIVLNESPTPNWAIDGGAAANEADIGFKIDI